MPFEITHATTPTPGGVSEAAVVTGPAFAFVLDGATATGATTGCAHDVSWYVEQLAGLLCAQLLTQGPASLREILRTALTTLVGEHGQTCDMTNADSPSSTVAVVREHGGSLDVLVLGHSPVALHRTNGAVEVIVDDRAAYLDSYAEEAVRGYRNSAGAGGFWVAGAKPEAADQALTASIPLSQIHQFAVLSEGAARLPERYGWSWPRFMAELSDSGPGQIIAVTREAETGTAAGAFRGRTHDTAAVVLCRPSQTAHVTQTSVETRS
ncbi:hypothetical protein [Kitasatospora herbaricolor]|uniref:Protein phosphatase 2C-like protein n=1 Tax=Kitasatospora herbaricolor TaxID=68217 RepID=A0ABZ1WGS1_9ACTN|nr:hypothetical protein [Kitasatospora herbaricolor]